MVDTGSPHYCNSSWHLHSEKFQRQSGLEVQTTAAVHTALELVGPFPALKSAWDETARDRYTRDNITIPCAVNSKNTHIGHTLDRSDPHLMISIFQGRRIPDIHDLRDLDNVFASWDPYDTTLVNIFHRVGSVWYSFSYTSHKGKIFTDLPLCPEI